MAFPAKPTIRTSYTGKAQALGDNSLPGPELDADFGALRAAIDAYIDFVRGFTRSDGRLANGSVRRETLAGDILIGFDPPSAWATGTAYVQNATVFQDARFYICTTAHTSGTFSTDLAAGRWELLADFSDVAGDVLSGNQTISGNWRFDGTVNTTGGFFINGAPVTVNTAEESRELLGLEIGADVQAFSQNLASLSGLTFAANKGLYTTAANTAAVYDLTAFGRTLAGTANASAARAALELQALATKATVGTADINDNAVTTAKVSNGAITAEKLAAGVAPGIGATRSTPTRAVNTIYTNSGTTIRRVAARVSSTAVATIYFEISGPDGPFDPVAGRTSVDNNAVVALGGWVPPGGRYTITVSTGTPTVVSWAEYD